MTHGTIGQGRKTATEMAIAFAQEIRNKLAQLNVRVETKTNDYGALVAIAYRDERKIAETGIDSEREAERKILLMIERDPSEDKQRSYEERFIRQARAPRAKRAR